MKKFKNLAIAFLIIFSISIIISIFCIGAECLSCFLFGNYGPVVVFFTFISMAVFAVWNIINSETIEK